MNSNEHRLPTHVVPKRYQLEIAPNIAEASFVGVTRIDIEVCEETSEIVCNAAELEIASAKLSLAGGSEIACKPKLDPVNERLHLQLGSSLSPQAASLEIKFAGTLNDKLRGFYRSTFEDDSQTTHTIATTQFQSTDARRAFPCWDEPAFKARFATTLIVHQDHQAISNTAVVHEELTKDGLRRVTFEETMPMSTYLVAFVVGPLEVSKAVDVEGVAVRVVHRPGRGHLYDFALEVAAHGLRWFSKYYGIDYPSNKLDLVAIPDFAFGAMENFGCITFREVLLLIDPTEATQEELIRAAVVIDHELAHMWFGDLVTMKWWEGIWLNEAFATFMENACTDAFRPEWQMWTRFSRDRSMAFTTDALTSTRPVEYEVVTPAEAEGMFDVLTYEKGASLVRMLEQFLGPETFRQGINHYLDKHQYSNTDTNDLWDALEKASGQPVGKIMNEWIYQGGFPLIEVKDSLHGAVVSQRQFTFNSQLKSKTIWSVPLSLRPTSEADGEKKLLLSSHYVTLTNTFEDDIKCINADASGFFRVRPHKAAMHAAISGQLKPSERYGLVDDAWALCVAGELSVLEYLEFAFEFENENDHLVWLAISKGLGHIQRFMSNDEIATVFSQRVSKLANKAMAKIGLSPQNGENLQASELKATLLVLLGNVACDPQVIEAAAQMRFNKDPNLAQAALSIVAHHGSEAEFEDIHNIANSAKDPQTEQRHLAALADFRNNQLASKLLEAIEAGKIRTQDGPYLIRRALTNDVTGNHVWHFVAGHWDNLAANFPANSIARMLEGIVMLDTEKMVSEVSAFLAAHPVPQGALQIQQHLERQQINSEFCLRVEAGELAEWHNLASGAN